MANFWMDADDMLRRTASVRSKLPDYAGAALVEELEVVEVPECQREVPFKTGKLHDTIHVEGPYKNNGWIQAYIVAGSDEVDYATKVHEDLEAFHPHGKAKYIEDPLFASRPFIGQRIANRMQLGDLKI